MSVMSEICGLPAINKQVIAVDSEDSKKIDDAFSVTVTDTELCLQVFITDPSPELALEMGPPDYVMAPSGQFSTDAPKRAIIVSITVDRKGELLDASISLGSVKITQRLTWDQSGNILKNPDHPLYEHWSSAKCVAQVLGYVRNEEIDRLQIDTSSSHRMWAGVSPIEHMDSVDILREFIVWTQIVMANYTFSNNVPVIYRDIIKGGYTTEAAPQTGWMARNGLDFGLIVRCTSPMWRSVDAINLHQVRAHLLGLPLPHDRTELVEKSQQFTVAERERLLRKALRILDKRPESAQHYTCSRLHTFFQEVAPTPDMVEVITGYFCTHPDHRAKLRIAIFRWLVSYPEAIDWLIQLVVAGGIGEATLKYDFEEVKPGEYRCHLNVLRGKTSAYYSTSIFTSSPNLTGEAKILILGFLLGFQPVVRPARRSKRLSSQIVRRQIRRGRRLGWRCYQLRVKCRSFHIRVELDDQEAYFIFFSWVSTDKRDICHSRLYITPDYSEGLQRTKADLLLKLQEAYHAYTVY